MTHECNCKLANQIKGHEVPDSHFDPKELKMGIKDEMEHTNDPEVAKAIAKGHLLFSNNHYYSESKKRNCP